MRKGSTKKLTEIKDPERKTLIPSRNGKIVISDDTITAYAEVSLQKSILLRLCDACHEMDNRIEPWASIRKDIENLR